MKKIDSGLYLGDINQPYGKKTFPYNIMKLRKYLNDTKKTLEQLTKEEVDKFLIRS